MTLLTIAATFAITASHVVGIQDPPAGQGTAKVSYRFVMLHGTQRVGTASYERITSASERHTLLTIDETDSTSGDTIIATIESVFKRDGTPEKKSFHGTFDTIPFSRSAVFAATGVQYSVTAGAKPPEVKLVLPPTKGVLADASEGWFDGVKPKIGDIAEFANFNVQTGGWEQTTTKYIGDVETKIGSKSFKTHHINVKSDTGEIEMFIDDNSDIVVMDQVGAVRLERAD